MLFTETKKKPKQIISEISCSPQLDNFEMFVIQKRNMINVENYIIWTQYGFIQKSHIPAANIVPYLNCYHFIFITG